MLHVLVAWRRGLLAEQTKQGLVPGVLFVEGASVCPSIGWLERRPAAQMHPDSGCVAAALCCAQAHMLAIEDCCLH